MDRSVSARLTALWPEVGSRFPNNCEWCVSRLKGNGSCRFVSLSSKQRNQTEEPLRYEAMTGLSAEQLTELVARVHAARGGGFVSVGRAYALVYSVQWRWWCVCCART